MSTPDAFQQFVNTLPLNKTLREIMEEYPELAAKLLPIKIALEWLEGANHQLEQQWGNKDFSQLGSLIMRDASGLQGDNPLQGEDPYLNLNQDLVRAFSVLNLRRLSRHINTLIARDTQLTAAIPRKHLQEKTTRKAQKEGRIGGEVKAEKYKPLYEEIKRLFFLEKSINPGRTLKFYASQIEQKVELFIKQDPEPYKQIGSESDGIRDYHNYIARKLSSLNSSKANKK
ncbi:hypothetical protein H1I79_19960 [Aeromonas veronii]|uniref:hypothetical protein n=1 Tax=Aeromonas veronii TaxID=654 RepID=UPI0015EC97D2|nr:hypothetical protein [Aeromonas veronii]MBA2800652.1 hypothetical protein [Aeromonas veronii]